MNIQIWFPLGWTGLTFLQSMEFSRVFSSTMIQNHQFFFVLRLFYGPAPTSVYDYWENHSMFKIFLTYWVGKKVHLGFSVTANGKTQMNFWPTQHILFKLVTKGERESFLWKHGSFLNPGVWTRELPWEWRKRNKHHLDLITFGSWRQNSWGHFEINTSLCFTFFVISCAEFHLSVLSILK